MKIGREQDPGRFCSLWDTKVSKKEWCDKQGEKQGCAREKNEDVGVKPPEKSLIKHGAC